MAQKKKKSVKKSKAIGKHDLTIHFMPSSEVQKNDTIALLKKIMGLVLDRRIIILQGKLKSDQEVKLIENSMTLIGNIKDFQGIEIATISGDNEGQTLFNKVRKNIAKILVGEQDVITIIGPASVVKEIKKDPKKIELMLSRR